MNLPSHGFGGSDRISLSGDLAAVGAPGAEAVYLFQRTTTGEEGGGNWTAWGDAYVQKFWSSDFDYDVIHLEEVVHRQVRVRTCFKKSTE